jgi:hypothetical protein
MPTPSIPGSPQAAAGPERGALNPILTTALSAANELGVAKNVRPNAKKKIKNDDETSFHDVSSFQFYEVDVHRHKSFLPKISAACKKTGRHLEFSNI